VRQECILADKIGKGGFHRKNAVARSIGAAQPQGGACHALKFKRDRLPAIGVNRCGRLGPPKGVDETGYPIPLDKEREAITLGGSPRLCQCQRAPMRHHQTPPPRFLDASSEIRACRQTIDTEIKRLMREGYRQSFGVGCLQSWCPEAGVTG